MMSRKRLLGLQKGTNAARRRNHLSEEIIVMSNRNKVRATELNESWRLQWLEVVSRGAYQAEAFSKQAWVK